MTVHAEAVSPQVVATAAVAQGLDPTTVQKLLDLLVQFGGVFGPYFAKWIQDWLSHHLPAAQGK